MPNEWYILRGGQRHGPYTAGQLKAHATTGNLLPTDLVVKDGMTKAVPAGKVRGLFPASPDRATPPATGPSARPRVEDAAPAARLGSGKAGWNRSRNILLGGAGLVALAVVAVIAFVVAGPGPKARTVAVDGPERSTGRGSSEVTPPDRQGLHPQAAPASKQGQGGKVVEEEKAVLPDFSKVDYTLDTRKIDYERGPNGEKLVFEERDYTDGPQANTGYRDAKGELIVHGMAAGKYPDGRRKFETEYLAGKEHGKHTEWYPEGGVLKQGLMKDGQQHGVWTEFNRAGGKVVETHYLGNVPHGSKTEWYASGRKKTESTWVCGERWGDEVAWDERGGERFRLRWVRGLPHFSPQANTRAAFQQAVSYLHQETWKDKAVGGQLDKFFDAFGKPDGGYLESGLPKSDGPPGVLQEWAYQCRDGKVEMRVRIFGIKRAFRDNAGTTTKLLHSISVEKATGS